MQNSDKIYAERYDFLKEVPVQSRRKIQYRNDTVMTDEDITSSFEKNYGILLLCDSLYSACHRPCGSMTNADLTDAKETIQMLSVLWRLEKLSVTVKAHIIDNHLMNFLKRFRGLGQYDAGFMERGHQDGMWNERISANVKNLRRKSQTSFAVGYIGWQSICVCCGEGI